MSFIRQKPKFLLHKSQRQIKIVDDFPARLDSFLSPSLCALVGSVPMTAISSATDTTNCSEDSKDVPLNNTDDRPTQHPFEEVISSVVVSKWPKFVRQSSYYPTGQSPVVETKNAVYGKVLKLQKAIASPSSPSAFPQRRNSVSIHPIMLDKIDTEDFRQRNMSKMIACPSVYALDPSCFAQSLAEIPSSTIANRLTQSPSLSKGRNRELFPGWSLPPSVIWVILGQYCDIPTLSALALTSKDLYKLTCHSSLFKSIICFAQRGHTEAQAKLGYMHEKGFGVIKENEEEALYWYQRSIGMLNPLPKSPATKRAGLSPLTSPETKRVGATLSPNTKQRESLSPSPNTNRGSVSPVASPSTKRSVLSRSGNVYVSRPPSYQVVPEEVRTLDGHFFLGWSLVNGKYKTIEDAENQGFYHILLAGLGGHPWAQYWMGLMYENSIAIDNWKIDPIFSRASMAVGLSVSPETATQVRLFAARYWYVHAASSGLSSKAAGSLGRIYIQSVSRLPSLATPKTGNSEDPTSNLAKAFCWLRIAALKSGESGGDAQAQNLYGSIYETGMRVTFDLLVPPEEDEKQRVRSFTDVDIPLALSDPLTIYNFSHRRRSVSFPTKSNALEDTAAQLRMMLTREMEEEEARALLFFVQESRRVISKQVHVVVIVNGTNKDIHTIHLRVKSDLEEAAHWYQAAARKGYADAEANLARLSLAIDGDLKRAAAWASSAARKGNKNGMNVLGAVIELSGKLKQKQKSKGNKPEVLNTLALNAKRPNPELQVFAPMPKNLFQQANNPNRPSQGLLRTTSVKHIFKESFNEQQSPWKRTTLAEVIHEDNEEHFKVSVEKKNRNAFSKVLNSNSSSISNLSKLNDKKTSSIILHSGSTPGINIKKPTKASALKVIGNVPAGGSPLMKRVEPISVETSEPTTETLPAPSVSTLSNVIKRLSIKMNNNSNPNLPIQVSIVELEAERDARRWYIQASTESKFEQPEMKVCPEAAFNLGRLILMMGVHDGNQVVAQAFEACLLQNPLTSKQFGAIEIGFGMNIASSVNVTRYPSSAANLISKSPLFKSPADCLQLNANLISAVRLVFGEDLALHIHQFKDVFANPTKLSPETVEAVNPVSIINEGIKYFTIAAELGLSTAQLVMARWYLWKAVVSGEEALQMLAESFEMYEKAAAQDDINAIIELGKLYLFGLQKQPPASNDDLKKLQIKLKLAAKGQFLLAAESGSSEAACLLGEIYLEEAVNASQENKQTEKKKGSKIGNKSRASRAFTSLISRKKSNSSLDDLAGSLIDCDSESQLENDKADAIRWLELAAERNCARAKRCLNKIKEDKPSTAVEVDSEVKGRNSKTPKEHSSKSKSSSSSSSSSSKRASFIPKSVSEVHVSNKYNDSPPTTKQSKPSTNKLTSVFSKTKSLIHRKNKPKSVLADGSKDQ